MGRELDTVRNRRHGRSRERDALIVRDEQGSTGMPVPWAGPSAWSNFFTFRYTSTEIYSQDGNVHVKTTQTRYQDGRLTQEECEGTLDRRAYERMADQAQGYFLNQVGSFMKLLCAPFAPRSRHWDD